MIKIEFNEAQPLIEAHRAMFDFGNDDLFSDNTMYKVFWEDSYDIKSITPYIPTQDPMLDREHILKIQCITKEQDEENQV